MREEAQEVVDLHRCEYCGSQTEEDIVNMALWEEGRLVVIEDIPARVCKECLEQYYDDITRFKIDKLRGDRFPMEKAKEVIEVPVFSLTSVDVQEKRSTPQRGKSQDGGTVGGAFVEHTQFPDEL